MVLNTLEQEQELLGHLKTIGLDQVEIQEELVLERHMPFSILGVIIEKL